MKMAYKNKTNTCSTLRTLDQATVFRPRNSRTLYMTTKYTGMDDIFSNTAYEDYYENIQYHDNEPSADYLCACVELDTGNIVFFHSNIEVEQVECCLVIEEEE